MTTRPMPTETEIAFARRRTLVRLVDDDAELRDALQFVLELEGWRTAAYGSADEFLRSDAPSEPGCVVMDVRMPGMTGLEAQQAMNALGMTLPVIFLTGHGDVDMAVSAMMDGASDFIQKPIDNERLLASIARAAVKSLSQAEGLATPAEARRRIGALTGREKDLARLLAQGLTNRDMAERLGIALRTVEVHRASVLRKLAVKTPKEVAALLSEAELAAGSENASS